jgi:predicted Zn-dependent peptidase
MRKTGVVVALCAAALLLGQAVVALQGQALGFRNLEQQVVDRTLPNGLRVLILPRAGAPVVSMVTYADVGGVDENQNLTGLAHIFEHMAFKGTKTIGTKDLAREMEALQKEDQAFLALRAERLRRPKPDPARLKELESAFAAAKEEAAKFVDVGRFGELLEQEGAQGLNAYTSLDQTVYIYSLPSNKLELWAALESDRFTNPILREFYKEKDVIMEERRMGESTPTRRLLEDFCALAYKAHMYRSLVIGHMSDLQGISRDDAAAWFKRYYGARNLTAVIVGDVDPVAAWPMLEKWLGQIPPGEKPGPVATEEPSQRGEKRLVIEDPSQPMLVIGYHRVAASDPDAAAFDALSSVLSGGPSSRLFRSLVKEKQLALNAQTMAALGEKYPGLFVFIAMPNRGRTNAECEAAIDAEIERLKTAPVSAEELAGVKAQAKSTLINRLSDNLNLATELAQAQNIKGDWRLLFRELDDIDRVTPADIQRIAQRTFVKSNRTVAVIETVPPAK